MLTGKELGAALAAAMEKKGVKQGAVAEAFGVQQPSVSEWTKLGRIGKKHINRLVAYFLDVVPPTHWGLPESWQPDLSAEALELARIYDGVSDERKRRLLLEAARQVNSSQPEDGESPGNGESPGKADTPSTQTDSTGAGDAAGTRSSTWQSSSREMGAPLKGRKLTKEVVDPGSTPKTTPGKKGGSK